MAKLYVIQTGQTTLEEQNRFESAAGAPLTEQGKQTVVAAAGELADHEIKIIYACTVGESERQTAELVAKTIKAKVRDNKKLHELDYGLWQGLTVADIKRCQPRAYRQWTKTPASVLPPEGETITQAQDRLRDAVKKILKRHKKTPALLVLRPILTGLLKCMVEEQGVDVLWQHVDMSFSWGCYEMDDKSL